MKEKMAVNAQLECIICGIMVPSVYKYHTHNIRRHSLAELSRAILKLKNLPLPLNDPPAEVGNENEEEQTKGEQRQQQPRFDVEVAEALGLSVRVDLMDEEIIELGPTDNADHLQIQSRQVKNLHEKNQQSRQVIEVKENKTSPCYTNPTAEDPDAIVVKFNRELFTAQDNSSPSLYTGDTSKTRLINRQMRAVVKRTIDIPNPNTFIMDYKKAMSRSNKYIMQNISVADNSPKKRRGRPKKNAENDDYIPSKIVSRKKLLGEPELSEEEDDLEGLVDPPLFSEDEDEEADAVMPNITRTRSGRTIKIKAEDGTFEYYDIPGRHQVDTDDLNSHKYWNENSIPIVTTGERRGRKRKQINKSNFDTSDPIVKDDSCKRSLAENTRNSVKLLEIKKELDCKITNVIEDLVMPTTNEIVEDSKEFDRSSIVESFDGYECFLCLKSFNFKDCEKHIHEHLHKEIIDNETAIGSSHEFDDKVSDNSHDVNIRVDATQISKDANAVASVVDIYTKSDNHLSTDTGIASQLSTEFNDSFTCSICNEDFDSRAALLEHTHENIYTCKLCGKKYQKRLTLQSHMKRYHEETDWMKFKCATCGKNFGFLTSLERHMKEHNPNKKFCCEQCGKVFKSLVNLKIHIGLHTKDEVYECPYCPKKYYIRYSFEKHFRTHVEAPKFHCEMCDKNFSERKHFEVHLERHQNGGSLGRSKDLKCNNCGDIKSPTELEIVSGTDPGHHKKCLECGKGLYKRFMIENIDTSSLQIKSDKQREQCKLCGKSVLNLQRHLKHTHLENDYVPCHICGVLVTKSSLPAHKNRKHGGSAVTCDHCNKVFKNIMCLREHMTKVRRKEDPTKNICKFCKEVIAPELWKEHMMRHRTKCNDCGASNFPTHEEFMAHLETCRRCSNCGTTDFNSRGEFLDHIEICSSSIDIMTGTLDSSNDQEIVTSIFAIDDCTCCETCGEVFESPETLAHHITEAHQSALSSSHILDQNAMIDEAILYACP
ncbi:hypothetical protein OTU49_010633 [Cherax quadricarinatus]|uniref:C2H2-type domain-containing protein n=3 Tax=Cherax quadricarinatus TaxID=27406 RepID=A0AAW0WCV7_CHEQU|nr:uncharacterized protein LOC128702871 [Cherax quadricarinatus]